MKTAGISLEAVREARPAVMRVALRTPLVRLNLFEAPAEIYLKLENLQPIGSFKIRGAANVMARLSPDQLAHGVLTASAGNMAQGAAWNARRLGIPCTVIAPDTAPQAKVLAVERLGGRVIKVSFDRWWQTFTDRGYPGVEGAFVHPFDDDRVMAGNGTIGLEIVEDLEDVDTVLVPWGGGGLSCGIATAIKGLKPKVRVFAVEVETGAPLQASMAAGSVRSVPYQPSFVDGIGSKTVFADMLALAQDLLDGTVVVSLEEARHAIRLMAERNRVIAEGAGAVALAAALAGRGGGSKVVCVVSGGNIDLDVFAEIVNGD